MNRLLARSRLIFASSLFLLLIVAILFFFLRNTSLENNLILKLLPDVPRPVEVDKQSGQIAESAVPKDFESRIKAPTVALLPNRIPEDMPLVSINSEQKEQILSASNNFLARWETYPVPNYSASISPFTSPRAVGVVSRADSIEPKAEDCELDNPDENCTISSFYPEQEAALTVVDVDNRHAYVVGEGYVRYKSSGPAISYRGLVLRVYGIVLVPDPSGWKVIRAAAETVG